MKVWQAVVPGVQMATFSGTLHHLSLLNVCVWRGRKVFKGYASNTETLSIKTSAYQFRVNAQISL